MTDEKVTWLPNLVGGVSIWKLAADLNEPHMFDGRLLVPETEGSDSLPVKVTWDLAGLVPLAQARATDAAAVAAAVKDLKTALERVAEKFADDKGGYNKFKEALTMPGGLGTEGEGQSYFFDPKTKKVMVINWGASPRAIAGQEVRVFGWVDWAKMAAEKPGVPSPRASPGPGATEPTVGGVPEAAPEAVPLAAAATQEEPAKKEEDKQRPKGPRLPWILVAVLAAVIVLLLGLLLRSCQTEHNTPGTDGAADVASEGSSTSSDASGDASMADATLVADAAGDAMRDADVPDAADAASDGGGDAGRRRDGGLASNQEDEGKLVPAPGGAGVIFVAPGKPGAPQRTLPHRTDFHPDAVRWRVTEGAELLHSASPTVGAGTTFNVTLKHGTDFDSVKTEWQDHQGNWHPF